MKLSSRYCRSCGSKILVRNVCHNCRCHPLQGNNYCYDCGALTPLGIKCNNCGAKFEKKIPVKFPLIIGAVLLAVSIAATGIYFFNRPGHSESDKENKEVIFKKDSAINFPVVAEKTDTIKVDTIKTILPAENIVITVFSSEELNANPKSCFYFKKNHKDSVLFFSYKTSGFIKINGAMHELKRVKKGNDVSVFSDGNLQAKVIIEGLSGNSKEWLASVSLVVKDTTQKTLLKQKVYSTCIGF